MATTDIYIAIQKQLHLMGKSFERLGQYLNNGNFVEAAVEAGRITASATCIADLEQLMRTALYDANRQQARETQAKQ